MKVGVVLHVKSIVELWAPRSLESEEELQLCYMDHGQCTHKTKIVVYKNQMHTGLYFLLHSFSIHTKHVQNIIMACNFSIFGSRAIITLVIAWVFWMQVSNKEILLGPTGTQIFLS